jgi:hypothetical protein
MQPKTHPSVQSNTSSSNSSSLTLAPEQLERWIKTLDRERKGYVANRDLYHALYACGLEPTPHEMAKITADASLTPADRARALLELLDALGVSQDTCTNLVIYYRREGFQLRPDSFKYLTYKAFFVTRFLSYLVPFSAFFVQHWQHPNSTPFEKSPYKMIRFLLTPIMIFTTSVYYVELAMWLTGMTTTIRGSEIVTTFLTLCGIGLATQVAREGMTCSREGQALKQDVMEKAVALRYTTLTLANGNVVKGTAALTYFARACTGRQAEASNFLKNVCRSSGLEWHNSKNIVPDAAKRRASSIASELQESLDAFRGETEAADSIVQQRYNFFRIDGGFKVFSWIVALAFCTVPTVVGLARGEVTIIDADATTPDIWADASSIVVVVLGVVIVVNGVLKTAVVELDTADSFCKFLLGTVGDGSGWQNKQNEELDFRLRLDSPEAVENFEVLYNFFRSAAYSRGLYHKAPFQFLIIICLSCVGTVFVGSAMDMELDTWNVMMFLEGGGVLFVMTKVFFKLVLLHQRLGKDMLVMLRNQRRLNRKLINKERLAATRNDELMNILAVTCDNIDLLCESIADAHKPMVLLGVIPLTKENVIKGATAITAGLFTTLLRSAVNT